MSEILASKMSRKKKITLIVVAAFCFLLIVYGTILYNDYNRVMRQYTKPAFAINHDPVYQEYYTLRSWEDPIAKGFDIFLVNYGLFEGLGYTIELSGSFRPYSETRYPTGQFDDQGREVLRGENDAIRDEETGEILNPVPGVLQARMVLFGKEIARIDRAYPEDNFVPRGFEMKEIF